MCGVPGKKASAFAKLRNVTVMRMIQRDPLRVRKREVHVQFLSKVTIDFVERDGVFVGVISRDDARHAATSIRHREKEPKCVSRKSNSCFIIFEGPIDLAIKYKERFFISLAAERNIQDLTNLTACSVSTNEPVRFYRFFFVIMFECSGNSTIGLSKRHKFCTPIDLMAVMLKKTTQQRLCF